MAAYAGEYRDPRYGKAVIALDWQQARYEDVPHAGHGRWHLEHWQHDTFLARWRDTPPPDAFVTLAPRCSKAKWARSLMTAL